MASPAPPLIDGSDKNCEISCNLHYGISKIFNQNVIKQQSIKASKGHIKPQIFDDPNEHSNYIHMMDDPMLKIFDAPSEKKIFRTALEGMNSNYPEILQGTEKHMFYCPTAFNTDSRMQTNETSVPDVLDKMKASLEAKQKLTQKEKTNLKVIQNHLKKLRPQLAEQEFVDALSCFFYQHRGIFIHSLKLDDHLKVLTDKAKLFRLQNKTASLEFTDLESKLAEQFNISEQKLNVFADDIVKHLLSIPKVTNRKFVNGRVIREAVDDQLAGNELMYIKRLFKPGQDYSIFEIKNGCKLGKFESEINFAGESDLLIMLPDIKVILSIEIKRHMKCKDRRSQTKPTSGIDNNMKSASSQLSKNAEFISSRHGAILSPDWQFVKVCAISPSLNSSKKICKNCRRFILTSDILKTSGGLNEWWKKTGLADRAKIFDQKENDDAYAEFQLFFNRLVCLSSVRIVPDPFHTWSQIQGDNPYHMSAGHTRANQGVQNKHSSGDVDVRDMLNRSHDAFKVLFFNKDQMALLIADRLFHALFMCDFGAGSDFRLFILYRMDRFKV